MAAKIYSVCKYEKVESQVNSNILKNPVNEISLQSVRDIFIIKYASDRRDSIGTEIYCDSGGGNPGSENFCSQILGGGTAAAYQQKCIGTSLLHRI